MQSPSASDTWDWHGYSNSLLAIDGRQMPVVSGGAHWGGGLVISAHDLALLGQLYLQRGNWGGQQLLRADWIEDSWRQCEVNPDYGYLWWLNTPGAIFPTAPRTGRCAQGNRSQHLLWVDPARGLVVATHWSPDIGAFLAELSNAVPPGQMR
jgi:CubicO group peptidase (beta-lactamase class C family)